VNLDVSKNTELEALYCSSNQLSVLDVSRNPELKYLWCGFNLLSELNITNNKKLINLIIYFMPTFTKLCVWTFPVPSSLRIDNTGCPNMSISTDCGK